MNNNKLLIINGPGLSDLSNLNEMGYGHLTLDMIRKKCAETCEIFGIKMDFRQTDDETELSRFLIEGIEDFDALSEHLNEFQKKSYSQFKDHKDDNKIKKSLKNILKRIDAYV